jgi:hypothetical protein
MGSPALGPEDSRSSRQRTWEVLVSTGPGTWLLLSPSISFLFFSTFSSSSAFSSLYPFSTSFYPASSHTFSSYSYFYSSSLLTTCVQGPSWLLFPLCPEQSGQGMTHDGGFFLHRYEGWIQAWRDTRGSCWPARCRRGEHAVQDPPWWGSRASRQAD